MSLAAMAMMTSRIGLVATCSTTYTEPYNLARQFAALDIISNGRAGWNLVTSAQPMEALNYSMDGLVDHDARYARAEEYADVVTGLWDNWAPDALVRDKAEGALFRSGQGEPAGPQGKMLPGARAAQRHVLAARAAGDLPGRLVGAGHGSGRAGHGDCVFTLQATLEGCQDFYRSIKARIASDRAGTRSKVQGAAGAFFPGGGGDRSGSKGQAATAAGADPSLTQGLAVLSSVVGGGVDLTAYDPGRALARASQDSRATPPSRRP